MRETLWNWLPVILGFIAIFLMTIGMGYGIYFGMKGPYAEYKICGKYMFYSTKICNAMIIKKVGAFNEK